MRNLCHCNRMGLSERYAALVNWFGSDGSISDTVLHIHGGMFILIVVRLITGRSLNTPWPFLAVLLTAFAKEFMDFLAYGRVKTDTPTDIINTIFWPAVLFIALNSRQAGQSSKKFPVEDHIDTQDSPVYQSCKSKR